jgi:hypothetical protein
MGNKYRRALKIKRTEPQLRETMAMMGVESRSVFETWLEKEKEFLDSLSKEPEEETLQMEYYQKLVNLRDQECVRNKISQFFLLMSQQGARRGFAKRCSGVCACGDKHYVCSGGGADTASRDAAAACRGGVWQDPGGRARPGATPGN